MRTFGDAVAQLRGAEAAGFSFSLEQARRLLQEGVDRFASESEWIKAELALATSVAGQEEYELPAHVVRVLGLTVDGSVYSAVDVQTIWQYKSSGLPQQLDGVFSERYNEDGKLKTVGLLPIPEVDGQSIAGLAAITPGDLEDEDELPFPTEYRRGPLNFAKGIAYGDVDENAQAADYWLGLAQAEADGLKTYGRRRMGSGPYRIPVATARARR